nr:gamma-glutamylcyclotransferase family protein [Neobacillus sp. Marseille-Q6967]
MENHYVFVYGTLRKHEPNHFLLKDAALVAEQAWTDGSLYDTGLGYPAVKESETDIVYGELYLVNEEQLQSLDELEDFHEGGPDNLYDRKKQIIYYDKGQTEGFIYLITNQNENLLKKKINLGDWKEPRIHNQNTILYFAYGSCMDDARFKLANVDHYFKKVTGRGILDGYTLRYSVTLPDGGRADIVEEGGTVEGIVYEIPVECLTYLYKREGVETRMYRPAFIDLLIDGSLVKDVLTFIVVNKQPETAPPSHYSDEIIRGASGILSDSYINQLTNHIKILCKQK